MEELPPFRHAGARALVSLHDRHLRSCMGVWERAVGERVDMPESDDPDYASLETLGAHVLGCARYYMVWCCEMLSQPGPDIDPAPGPDAIVANGSAYLEHLLERWRSPLADLPGEIFEAAEYRTRWGRLYSIDSMLEHAVMHPIRHEYQLLNWMK